MQLREMEFWAVEKLLQNYEESVEEENKQYNKQKADQEKQYNQSKPSMSQPKYGGFTVPKMDIPKFNMPKT